MLKLNRKETEKIVADINNYDPEHLRAYISGLHVYIEIKGHDRGYYYPEFTLKEFVNWDRSILEKYLLAF
jgi:hypothetical protein